MEPSRTPPDAGPADVVVVGAGAAGLVAAIRAAESGARVLLFNSRREIGLKILMSGGGRCNLTHAQVEPAAFHGSSPRAIGLVLKAFPAAAACAWFEEIGVPLKEEPGGKVFPAGDSARTVLAALQARAAAVGVEMHAGVRVTAIAPVEPPGFLVTATAGVFPARAVVLCTGGLSYPKTGSDGSGYDLARALGHSITRLTPALTPLRLAGSFHGRVQGITQPVALTLWQAGRRRVTRAGSLLWTHFGISGPAALDMSRHWLQDPGRAADRRLTAHFLPGPVNGAGKHGGPVDPAAAEKPGGVMSASDLDAAWIEAAAAHPALGILGWLAGGGGEPGAAADAGVRPALRAGAGGRLPGHLPVRFIRALAAEVGVDHRLRLGQVPRAERRRLIEALTAFPLAVEGALGYEKAEVTAGGVPLAEVDPRRMASRVCPGLFLAGEMLDVDGRLGGCNFQWAWSSGRVAGQSAAAWARGER